MSPSDFPVPASLRVLAPGLHTLVVDAGRPSCRSLGVPVGGPADGFALALGNALVGNPPGAAALEVTLAGPTLEAVGEVACVLYGAPFDLVSDRQELRAGTTFTLQPGEQLRIRGTARGARAYLCVRGGLLTPLVLGSRSGLAPLRGGEVLPCLSGHIGRRFVNAGREGEVKGQECVVLRVLDGAQAGWFDGAEFYGEGAAHVGLEDSAHPTPKPPPAPMFLVTPASNRMGLRLQGAPLRGAGREMVSEPVCPGTVQVTRDGQCIVLGVDGHTIGGYPKIATVIRADLDILGQLRPGQRVCFRRVRLEEAEALWRARQAVLWGWVSRLRRVAEGG